MSHTHTMNDTDPRFYIDVESRTIESLSEDPVTLVKGDHNSEIFTFEMDRYIDEHDVKLCNKVEVHYINIDANNGKNRSPGLYTVTDLKVDPEDSKSVIFTWKIPITATTYAGALSFIVRFECTEGEEILYAWNTTPCNETTVLDSIYNTDFIEEEYTDVIGEWYSEILNAKEQALDEIGKSGGIVVSETEPTGENVNVWVDNSDDEYIQLLEASDCVKMANAIKNTDVGKVIKLSDVSPLEHGVKAKVHGKNLFNGVLQKGHYLETRLELTNTSSSVYRSFQMHLNKGIYTISFSAKVYILRTYLDEILKISWITDQAYTFETKTDGIVGFSIRTEPSGDWDDNITIQIEEGNAATAYEPYIDPTTVTVTCCGKNLIDLSQFCNDFFRENSVNNYTFEKGPNAGDRFSKKVPFNIPAGVDICVSMDVVDYTTSYEMLFMIFTHSDGTETYPGVELTSGERSISITKPVTYIQFYMQSSEVEDSYIMFKNFQMELGTNKSDFESYKEAKTYTPASDGSVEIDSVSPNMTVLTDTVGVNIELEYNEDINKVLTTILEVDQTYTDAKVNLLRQYVDKQNSNSINSANSYTNTSIQQAIIDSWEAAV